MFVVIKLLFGLVFKMVRWIIVDGVEEDIFLSNVYIGDLFCVWLGEKVVIDGVVVEGESVIDELMLIGEFVFVIK